MLSQASLTPVFKAYDSDINKTISFRRVSLQEDLERLHHWMNQVHVMPYWELDGPLSQYKTHLKKALADDHQTLYIGCLDGVPMSYWEAYWVHDDVVGKSYDYNPFDQGVHLLIGPEAYLGKGYALPFLRSMVRFQFQEENTDVVVAEPDIRNKKMIHIFERCGFKAQKAIELPDKRALLMFCYRDVFERRWDDA